VVIVNASAGDELSKNGLGQEEGMKSRSSRGAVLGIVVASALVLVVLGVGFFFLTRFLGGGIELQNAHDSGMLAVAKRAPTVSVRLAPGDQATIFGPVLGDDGGTPATTVTLPQYNQLYAYTYLVQRLANQDNSSGRQRLNAQRATQALYQVAQNLDRELKQQGQDRSLLAECSTYSRQNSVRMLKANEQVNANRDLNSEDFRASYLDRQDGLTQIKVSDELLGEAISPNDTALGVDNVRYLRGYQPSSFSRSLPGIQGAVVNPDRQPRLTSNSVFEQSQRVAGYPSNIPVPPNSFRSDTSVSNVVEKSNLSTEVRSSSIVGLAPSVQGFPPVPALVREGYLHFRNSPPPNSGQPGLTHPAVTVEYNSIPNYTNLKDVDFSVRYQPVILSAIPGFAIVTGNGGLPVGLFSTRTKPLQALWTVQWIAHNKDPENVPAPFGPPPPGDFGLPEVIFLNQGAWRAFASQMRGFVGAAGRTSDIAVAFYFSDTDFYFAAPGDTILAPYRNFVVNVFGRNVRSCPVTYSGGGLLTAGEFYKAEVLDQYRQCVANFGNFQRARLSQPIQLNLATGMRSWGDTLFFNQGRSPKKVLGVPGAQGNTVGNAFRFTRAASPSLLELLQQSGQESLIASTRSTNSLAYRLYLTAPEKLTVAKCASFLSNPANTLDLGDDRYAYFNEKTGRLVWSSNPPTRWGRGPADGGQRAPEGNFPKDPANPSRPLDMNTYLLDPSPDEDYNTNSTRRPVADRGRATGIAGRINQIVPKEGFAGSRTDWGVTNRLFDARSTVRPREGRLGQSEARIRMLWEVIYNYGSGINGNLSDVFFQERLQDTTGRPLRYQFPL
jgi:hypothetical protein